MSALITGVVFSIGDPSAESFDSTSGIGEFCASDSLVVPTGVLLSSVLMAGISSVVGAGISEFLGVVASTVFGASFCFGELLSSKLTELVELHSGDIETIGAILEDLVTLRSRAATYSSKRLNEVASFFFFSPTCCFQSQ